MKALNPFTIDYLITSTRWASHLIGTRSLLIADARAMNPPADKYSRSDADYSGGFESTMLREWEEISVTVNGIITGDRNLSVIEHSKSRDFQQFFKSAGDGQRMLLNTENIGGMEDQYYVKLISTSNQLKRQKTKQKYNASFTLEIVE